MAYPLDRRCLEVAKPASRRDAQDRGARRKGGWRNSCSGQPRAEFAINGTGSIAGLPRLNGRLSLLAWNLLPLLSSFGKTNGDCLLAALYFAAPSFRSAAGLAFLIAMHLAFYVAPGTGRIFSLSLLLCHGAPPQTDRRQYRNSQRALP
jgi:hypothetical protein